MDIGWIKRNTMPKLHHTFQGCSSRVLSLCLPLSFLSFPVLHVCTDNQIKFERSALEFALVFIG